MYNKNMHEMKKFSYLTTVIFLILSLLNNPDKLTAQVSNQNGIEIYPENAHYWMYNGEPVLLIGGSNNDNLFQDPMVKQEVKLLKSVGGNYLRCVMSARDEGDAKPYLKNENGKYDLERFNPEYWDRFKHFLEVTAENDVIVQIELWATYDFYSRTSTIIDGKTAWERNPFNPANNINYSESESGLYALFRSNGYEIINPFFNTVLPLPEPFNFKKRPVVLAYQQKYVDKLLSISLKYDHVLYSIDNETQADPKWSVYWSQYIREKAADSNLSIEVTEMFDPFDPTGGAVEDAAMQSPSTHFFTLRSNVSVTMNDPENFSFIEISNHNAQVGQVHFETGYYIWKKLQESGFVRPVNNVKIYGAGVGGWNGSAKDGKERFWRNVFAGAASVRFHRPTAGLGKNDVALAHIKSMRILTDSMDFFKHKPANHLLLNREKNEAYCLAIEGKEYAIYFTSEGEIKLNVHPGKYEVNWLNIRTSQWSKTQIVEQPGALKTPSDDQWVVFVQVI